MAEMSFYRGVGVAGLTLRDKVRSSDIREGLRVMLLYVVLRDWIDLCLRFTFTFSRSVVKYKQLVGSSCLVFP